MRGLVSPTLGVIFQLDVRFCNVTAGASASEHGKIAIGPKDG